MSSKAKAGQSHNSKRLWFSNYEKQLWIYGPELKFFLFPSMELSKRKPYGKLYLAFRGNLIVVVQLLSYVLLFATPWMAARQAPLSSAVLQSSLKFIYVELVMLSNHFIILPSVFASFRIFSNELALCIRRPMYWSFSFNINSSNEYSGLISFRIDWFDLLAVQGTLKSLLQHHSLKASILNEINPEYSLEGQMLKQKLQYSGHLMQRADS